MCEACASEVSQEVWEVCVQVWFDARTLWRYSGGVFLISEVKGRFLDDRVEGFLPRESILCRRCAALLALCTVMLACTGGRKSIAIGVDSPLESDVDVLKTFIQS